MKTNYTAVIATLIALNTLFLCQATEVFLQNSYGASIYYKATPTGQPQEIRNGVRARLGTLNQLEQADVSIAGGSALSVSYFPLKQTIAKIGFAANQQPNSDAVIYVDPSSFYQAWNIRVSWEKRDNSLSTFKSKEVLNQAGKEQLLKLLMFAREPQYSSDKLKNKPFSRIYDQPTQNAIDMVKEMYYNEVLLSEIYLIVDKQIPFKLNNPNESRLKQQILTFLNKEMNRLKQK